MSACRPMPLALARALLALLLSAALVDASRLGAAAPRARADGVDACGRKCVGCLVCVG